jgi:hydrogenase maturation protein HypF
MLAGGDAAARHPAQAAAGFVSQLIELPDLTVDPFRFGQRYVDANALIARNVRTFSTTSTGRLFDAVAALLGFTGSITFEGQAAIWLEHLARTSDTEMRLDLRIDGKELDWRGALDTLIRQRRAGVAPAVLAAAFHHGLAAAIVDLTCRLLADHALDTAVLSGGVFQNDLLLRETAGVLNDRGARVLLNSRVPPNDGGISLGQAAIVASSAMATRA